MRVEKSGQFQRQRRELPGLAMVGGIHAWSAGTLHGRGGSSKAEDVELSHDHFELR